MVEEARSPVHQGELSMGAPPFISSDNLKEKDVLQIAEEELGRKLLPLTFRQGGVVHLASEKVDYYLLTPLWSRIPEDDVAIGS